MTLLENLKNLLRPGSLSDESIWSKISKVIQDAISLTKAAGARFLCCDTLCIIQDDDATKGPQLALMAEIYNRSIATLIAIHGENANTPLLRRPLSTGQSIRKPYETKQILEQIERSTYSTRGWCYQERLLAKRRIYFLKDEVIYHCREDMFTTNHHTIGVKLGMHEESMYKTYHPDAIDRVDEAQEFGHGSEWPQPSDLKAEIRFWKKIIEDFSAKQLTDQSDVLDACSGIISALETQSKLSIIVGTPLTLLPASLLWVPRAGRTAGLDVNSTFKRRACKTKGISSTSRIPSWSWMGWCGSVALVDRIRTFQHSSMLAEINIFSDEVTSRDAKPTSGIHYHPISSLQDLSDVSPLTSDCISVLNFETATVPLSRLAAISIPNQTDNIYHLSTVGSDPLIPVGTSAGILWGSGTNPWLRHSDDNISYDFILLTKSDLPVYASFPEIPLDPKDLLPYSEDDNSEDDNSEDDNSEDDESSLLSKSVRELIRKALQPASDSEDSSVDDEELTPEIPEKVHEVYDVLLVQQQDGFAERIALGQIAIDVWEAMSPVRKLINLR